MPSISVGGGLVTSQDGSTAPDGILIRADDCRYRPNNPALWEAQGRSEFNSAAEAATIKGVRALVYDGATDVIVAHVDTNYREATLAATGTFGAGVTGLTGGLTLDSIHYNNEHILLNGVDRGRVRTSAGTYLLLGMLANTAVPTISRDAGVGTGFTLSTGKTITYWVEERVKSGSTIIKRNASTSTIIVTLTGDGTLDKPVITRPATVNSDATHWALYGTATDGTFPTGAEIAEVAIGTTTIEDTRTGTDPLLSSGALYETVNVSVAGLSVNIARNGPAPILTTGDVLEDAIVGWDTADRSQLRFSYTDRIHAWPSVNVVRFETKEEDEGVAFRSIGQLGLALMRDSAWRISTLPKPEDSAFQPERIKAQIDGALGITGPLACDIFSIGEGARLAYISTAGLIATDGYDWDTVSDDLDWEATISLANLSTAFLVNNPTEYRLEMTAQDTAGNVYDWYFHYHKSHLKQREGGGVIFKCTGPIKRASTCKARGPLNGVRRLFSGHSNGKVYLEAGQTTDASGTTITMDAETKDYYFAGIGGRARVNAVYTHHQAASGQSATVRLIQKNAKQDDTSTPATISLTRREATPTGLNGYAEAYRLRFQHSGGGSIALDYFSVDVKGAGEAKGL